MKKDNITVGILEDNIERLKKYFEIYPDKKAEKEIDDLVTKLNNQEYKIAVVANMSAGKSTFINALFGQEVLPSFNHATTDSATYIHSEVGIEQKAIIDFSDGKKQVEIKEDLEQEIKKYAQKDEDCKDDRYKNVEKIELFYPFQNLQTLSKKDFKIIFVDTPGPNSTGDYQEKHKDQTRSVLNDVDLALFMFDYTQLDANLSSDEQGLWHTIKERHDKDKNFDVYFVLNKIDEALNDNIKDISHENDKNKYIELKKKNWYKYEEIAIGKLKEASKKHGIDNPKIFPVSSKFQLLDRLDKNNILNFDDEDELDRFQKKHFKRVFDSSWEERYIEYLGISKLEEDINRYIDESVKQKILKRLDSDIKNIARTELDKLERQVQTLNQPKQEAEKNLERATVFLVKKTPKIENDFREKTLEIQTQYIERIRDIIDNRIEEELNRKIPEATDRTIKFLELLLVDNYKMQDAINTAKNLPKKKLGNVEQSFMWSNFMSQKIKIKIDHKKDIQKIENGLTKFIRSILNDYKNNYLDIKIDIKNNYYDLADEVERIFNSYKNEFNVILENTLEIKKNFLNENTLCKESSFSEDIMIPDSTISYKYQSEQYSSGGSFSSRKKIQDEEHYILVDRKNIEKIFKLIIDSMKRTYYNNEISSYKNNIVSFIKSYQEKFNDFKEEKKKEINRIKDLLKTQEESLKQVQLQKKEIIAIIKEI